MGNLQTKQILIICNGILFSVVSICANLCFFIALSEGGNLDVEQKFNALLNQVCEYRGKV